MGRRKDISESTKAEILAYLDCGKSQVETSRLSSVSQQSVSRIERNFTKNNLSARRKTRCGRKSVLTPRSIRLIVRQIKLKRHTTSTEMKSMLAEHGINVGASTIRTHLIREGYAAHRPRAKPKLTPAMRTKRLNWCVLHKDWTVDQWLNVGFSDESTFTIMQDKRQYVRRLASEEFHKDCIKSTVKHPTSQMVWSIICGKGPGRLHLVDGIMNGTKYLDVLKARLVPQIRDWYGAADRDFTFMQDSAPCHTAKLVMKSLKDDLKIRVLPWPGNSPDLNPLENLWELVKRKVAMDNPTTKKDLITSIIRHWHRDNTTEEYIVSLISSMPRRIAACIKARGGHTKY